MENLISIERHGFLGPVTALCWSSSGNFVLCGRGSSMLVMDTSRRILASTEVFESSRIHGIKLEESLNGSGSVDSEGANYNKMIVVAHGDKNVVVSELKISTDGIRLSHLNALVDLDDWVLDVQLLRDCADEQSTPCTIGWGRVAVGFAHNFVEIWRWASGERLQVESPPPPPFPSYLLDPALSSSAM